MMHLEILIKIVSSQYGREPIVLLGDEMIIRLKALVMSVGMRQLFLSLKDDFTHIVRIQNSLEQYWMKHHAWLLKNGKKSYVAFISLPLTPNGYWRFLFEIRLVILNFEVL